MTNDRRPNDSPSPGATDPSNPTNSGTPGSATFTANAMLIKPATAQRNWDVSLNANADALDAISSIGQLIVTPTELPSASLNVRVTGGSYGTANGTVGTFAGVASFALPASSSTSLWLDSTGALNSSAAFPTTAHVRLAQVVTGATSVTSVSDQRIGFDTYGTGLGFISKAGDTMTGSFSVVSANNGSTTLAVNPVLPGLGFFGTSPTTQAPAVSALANTTTGTASNTVTDVGATYSQAAIDNNFATLTVAVNALITAFKRHGLMSS